MKRFHMISGLPRSGTTLLSTILKQNPKFSAGITNPLNEAMANAIKAFSVPGVSTQCSEKQRLAILNGMIDGFYADEKCDVAFNTSRFWTSYLPLIDLLRPDAKVICCVRDIPWILDSFEKLYIQSPTIYTNAMYGESPEYPILDDVYRRADLCTKVIIGRALNSLKQGFFSPFRDKIFIVEYDLLASNPKETIKQIYDFIDEPLFKHNFNDVENSYDEYDLALQSKGLHTIRKKVELQKRNPIIPPDVWQNYSGMEFWRHEFT